jgi:hypothetical protein
MKSIKNGAQQMTVGTAQTRAGLVNLADVASKLNNMV